ncbi:MAG: VPLPA-CTERM sorting domain-containing protein [Pseudomonadota bacterium]
MDEAILGATISATGTGPAGLEISFRFDNALSIDNIPVGDVGLDGALASTPLGFREAGIDLVNAGISGHGALIGSTAFADEPGAFGLSYTATVLVGPRAIPLPATAWLMLAGVGGLAAMRRLALKMPKPQTGDLR